MSTRLNKARLAGTARRLVALPVAVLLLGFSGAARAQVASEPGKAAAADPGTGFEGRVVIDGQVLPGARVFAYKTFQDLLAHRPLAASRITADDGAWQIEVPRGGYYLLAKKLAAGADDGPVRAGDYSAYHGSNPISAVPGKFTHVGFSMEKLEAETVYEESARKDTGALSGVVTSGGEPLGGATVSVYPDARDDFRGLGFATLPPTGKSGVFRMDTLPEGDYFVIVRKRASGKSVGPIVDGDFFGFFGANPVRVRAGKIAKIKVAAVAKASEIGKDDSLFRDTGTHITGRVTDKEGRAVPGVYTFAYEEKAMALKRPAAISREVDADGHYVLNLPRGGVYYLGARSMYGDTPGSGEWYGRYEGTADHSVRIEAGNSCTGIDIKVERMPP